MDLDGETLGLDALPPSSPAALRAKDKNDSSTRFYCPHPGCNRSFAELWRLKVHYRAPPDIRGSGKERGHGTELTHCPKCGKTLKPGKHHVGCSGGKTAPRQVNKRSRPATEADSPDDPQPGTHPTKHVRGTDGDGDAPQHVWGPDFGRSSQGAYAITLQAPMKDGEPWPHGVQPGIVYGPNGTATACWLPGPNGFVPQAAPLGYHQAQFTTDLQFVGAHGYPQQMPTFSAYPQQAMQGLAESGHVLSLQPNGTLQPIAGVPGAPPGGLQAVNPLLLQQHPHAEQQQCFIPAAAVEHGGQQGAVASSHHPQQLGGSGMGQQGQSQPSQQQQQSLQGDGSGPGLAGSSGRQGSGTGAVVPAPAGSNGTGPSEPEQPQAPPSKPTSSGNDSLGSIFGDVEEFTRDFGRIPSPPPLPPDFHTASSGAGPGMLFNFGQFGQKLPRSSSHTRLDKNLSAMGLSIDPAIEGDLLYDHTDDGDLMQLLFGVPDELPTMATIHLHKWSNEADEEDGAEGGGGRPGPVEGGAASSGGAAERTGANGGAPGASSSSQAPPSPPPVPPPQQGVHVATGQNGKTAHVEAGDAHGSTNGPESYIVHHGGGGGKLGALLNGASGQGHNGDEHHRDHLLDAETFRLLQSCD
ncbi:hypothetical protein HYH03_015805 [Edaphochlamys debaryana]|uniref:Uncharacterized protein n=1 Tax=Edaphochlamys debaryana TaxID=47281 RepID=A0A835XMD0_9CHLO|nr:hypothetical protein HYH03_015805 [Edaphochlamys debaryana]|eukprot:KAG2485423.1 hypothetical protein HYH03_015805 [Edaphochlamys debaryana]